MVGLRNTRRLMRSFRVQQVRPIRQLCRLRADAMIVWPGCCSRLSSLDKPVLVISGLDDDILPEPLAVQISGEIDGSWLVRYKNATHWLMYQDPVGLGRTVNNFLGVNQDLMPQ